jgi:hypothetical protein
VLYYNNSNKELMRIDSNGNTGIGTGAPSASVISYSLWDEINKNAEHTPALKIALEKLINLHNLTKDHGNS